VIPTYNEKDNIEMLLTRFQNLKSHLDTLANVQLVFVDDNSPDATSQEILRLKETHRYYFDIEVLKREGKLCLGSAYIHGFKYAIENNSDYIVQMDADLSHEPEVIPSMINNLSNYDCVIGSRYLKGSKLPSWNLVRKIISRFGNYYAQFFLGFQIHDYTGGFNAYRKSVLSAIDLSNIISNGYSFQIEIKYRMKKKGAKFLEIPINYQDRLKGKSKFTRSIFVEAMINTIRLRLLN